MKKPGFRFLFYALLGLVFGIFDWFYLAWLAHISWGQLGDSILVIPIIIAMNYGIWLLPVIPIEINEARLSEKRFFPVLAGILTWSSALFSYYLYYAILLSYGKLTNLEHLSVFGDRSLSLWPEYWRMFDRIILSQFLEWIIIAILGGAVTGALIHWMVRKANEHLSRS